MEGWSSPVSPASAVRRHRRVRWSAGRSWWVDWIEVRVVVGIDHGRPTPSSSPVGRRGRRAIRGPLPAPGRPRYCLSTGTRGQGLFGVGMALGDQGEEGIGPDRPFGLALVVGLGPSGGAQTGSHHPQLGEDLGPPVGGVGALVAKGPFGVGPRREVPPGPDAAEGGEGIGPGRGGPGPAAPLSDVSQGRFGRSRQQFGLPPGVEHPGPGQFGDLGGREIPLAQGLLGAREAHEPSSVGQGVSGLAGRDPFDLAQHLGGVAVALVPPDPRGLDPGGQQGLGRIGQPFGCHQRGVEHRGVGSGQPGGIEFVHHRGQLGHHRLHPGPRPASVSGDPPAAGTGEDRPPVSRGVSNSGVGDGCAAVALLVV